MCSYVCVSVSVIVCFVCACVLLLINGCVLVCEVLCDAVYCVFVFVF